MFFELTDDMDKMERQMEMEIAAYNPIRYRGWAAATEVDYRRDDAEDSTNWQHVDSRWEDEADIDYNNSERGKADANAVLRKTARFGIHGNSAMKMREVNEIKAMMHDLAREGDEILLGITDPIQSLRFVAVGA